MLVRKWGEEKKEKEKTVEKVIFIVFKLGLNFSLTIHVILTVLEEDKQYLKLAIIDLTT